MKKKILIIAPHPDDETLGCGGTILRHVDCGDDVYWLIATRMHEKSGFSKSSIKKREKQIDQVCKKYKFKSKIQLQFEATKLDTYSFSSLLERFNEKIDNIKPSIIYLPFQNDVHSDHRITFQTVMSCTKQFRKKYIASIRAYETLSETEFNLDNSSGFKPNLFINIEKFMKRKLQIAEIYKSEFKPHPFPRSKKGMEALATLRGAMANFNYAEAFMILKEMK